MFTRCFLLSQITRSLLIVDEMIDGRVGAADFAGCSLDGSEHTSDGTQDSSLATGRNSACWRWLLEETTITSRAWKMGEGLTLESQDAAMRECLAQSHTGIIDEELRREVVGAINDEIPWLDDFLGIV